MRFTEILYITLAAFLALGFVFFSYLKGERNNRRINYLLAAFRFISIIILLLLLFNPSITGVQTYLEKPDLVIAIDQSQSIENLQQSDSLKKFKKDILANTKLTDQFNLHLYGFGSEIYPIKDSLNFEKKNTNQGKVLEELKKLKFPGQTALLFLTDGNQNIGKDYEYVQLPGNYSLFPLIIGDTTASEDISIANLNTNKYAFLKNKFPVELIVNYEGEKKATSVLSIQDANKTVYSKSFNFDKNNTSKVVKLELPASSLGSHLYTAKLSVLSSEKNILNNKQSFAVDVIEEKSSVLLLSSFIHPDLGALKKSIESNEQRTAKIKLIKDFNISEINDFQVFILYQPNNLFKDIFQEIEDRNLNALVITGTQTDWQFLNSVQQKFTRKLSTQAQEVVPVFNANYSQFQFEDIDFKDFPPLLESFGKLNFNTNIEPLLYQKIEGLDTQTPLLATFTENSHKSAVLFGENIWRWRAYSFQESSSFENFDNFFGKLIQLLSNTKKRDRLTFTAKPYYLEDDNITIDAQYFDKNYVFDPAGKVDIRIAKKDSLVLESPMLINNDQFYAKLNALKPGKYSVTISERTSGLRKSGNFSVLEFNREKQASSANYSKMKVFSDRNNSNLYFLRDQNRIIEELLSNSKFKPVQKSHKKTISLIDWKILLALLICSFAAEWFVRKYNGLI